MMPGRTVHRGGVGMPVVRGSEARRCEMQVEIGGS